MEQTRHDLAAHPDPHPARPCGCWQGAGHRPTVQVSGKLTKAGAAYKPTDGYRVGVTLYALEEKQGELRGAGRQGAVRGQCSTRRAARSACPDPRGTGSRPASTASDRPEADTGAARDRRRRPRTRSSTATTTSSEPLQPRDLADRAADRSLGHPHHRPRGGRRHARGRASVAGRDEGQAEGERRRRAARLGRIRRPPGFVPALVPSGSARDVQRRSLPLPNPPRNVSLMSFSERSKLLRSLTPLCLLAAATRGLAHAGPGSATGRNPSRPRRTAPPSSPTVSSSRSPAIRPARLAVTWRTDASVTKAQAPDRPGRPRPAVRAAREVGPGEPESLTTEIGTVRYHSRRLRGPRRPGRSTSIASATALTGASGRPSRPPAPRPSRSSSSMSATPRTASSRTGRG